MVILIKVVINGKMMKSCLCEGLYNNKHKDLKEGTKEYKYKNDDDDKKILRKILKDIF